MGTDSVIFIRTDGNSHIATGHLVRCLCIAKALEKEKKKVIFLLSDEESAKLLTELSVSVFSDTSFSFETIILKTAKFNALEEELTELTELLKSQTSPILFIDSYYVTPTYFTSLKSVAKLAYMDDLRSFDYDVDLLINYDVIPPNLSYQDSYTKADKLLLGAEYTPLRPQFQNQRYSLRENTKNILITTGGSDPYGLCETLADSFLLKENKITLHIVIGKLFTPNTVAALETIAAKSSYIKLHRNVTDMASLMKQCDLAVSAAGTTLYELCAIGVPAISFTFADNQLTMAQTFEETGAVPYAGDLRKSFSEKPTDSNTETNSNTYEIKESTLQNINYMLTTLSSDFHKRKNFHTQMKNLVDGTGTSKIAKALCQLT